MLGRALHVVSVLTSHEKGGAEYACVNMLAALASRGHHVRLLTDQPDLAAGTSLSLTPIDLGPKLRRKTVAIVLAGAPVWLSRLAAALRRERARAGPVHILLVHFKKEQLLAAVLPRRITGEVVWAEWGPLPAAMTHGLPRLLYRLAARRARMILAVSESTRRSLLDAGVPADRIEYVPNRVAEGATVFDPGSRERLRAEWGISEDAFVVGSVGRFHRKKRAEVLIEAMAHLRHREDAVLVLAGEGEQEPDLRRLAEDRDVPVRFIGTPGQSVGAVHSAFDLAVFAPAPTEGAPQAIVLAQLAGLPVVATDRPGAEELIAPGTGMIADPPQDPRAVAACIDLYREDVARREQHGSAGRRHALRHDPSEVDPRVEQVIQRAAAG